MICLDDIKHGTIIHSKRTQQSLLFFQQREDKIGELCVFSLGHFQSWPARETEDMLSQLDFNEFELAPSCVALHHIMLRVDDE